MNRIVTYALRHSVIVFALAVGYFVAGTIYHEDVQDIVRLIQREQNWMWGSIVAAGTGAGLWGRAIWKSGRVVGMGRWLWGGLLVSTVAGYLLLMSYPTEVVHYLQFGLLAAALAVAFRRVSPAIVLAATAGILDEAYQYWWLHRAWGVYFDFNDVLLNVVAAGLGLATMATLWPDVFLEEADRASSPGENEQDLSPTRSSSSSTVASTFGSLWPASRSARRSERDVAILFALGLLALFAIGAWTDLIALQTADVKDHTLLLLNRMPPFEQFWETWGGTTKEHHVVRAWWGTILLGVLTVSGSVMVKRTLVDVKRTQTHRTM